MKITVKRRIRQYAFICGNCEASQTECRKRVQRYEASEASDASQASDASEASGPSIVGFVESLTHISLHSDAKSQP
jgi:hypothetical protein